MSETPFRYLVHGCLLNSAFPISGLSPVPGTTPAHLSVDIAREHTLWQGDASAYTPWRPDDVISEERGLALRYWRGPEGYLIRFSGRADFLVAFDGKSIRLFTEEAELAQLTRDLLIGPVLANAFVVQDTYAIHGSSVTRDGIAIAFVGANGNGKSTLATSYVAEGWELLTDGMFVAQIEDGAALVQPGDPRIRVRADTAGRLKDLPNLAEADPASAGKHCVPVGEGGWGQFAQRPTRLLVAYILEPAEPDAPVSVESCTGMEGIMAVMTNTYGVGTIQNEFLGPHLKYTERFASAVLLRRLKYGKRIENLEAMRLAVNEDLALRLRSDDPSQV